MMRLYRLEKLAVKGAAETTPTLESIEALRNREEIQVCAAFNPGGAALFNSTRLIHPARNRRRSTSWTPR